SPAGDGQRHFATEQRRHGGRDAFIGDVQDIEAFLLVETFHDQVRWAADAVGAVGKRAFLLLDQRSEFCEIVDGKVCVGEYHLIGFNQHGDGGKVLGRVVGEGFIKKLVADENR